MDVEQTNGRRRGKGTKHVWTSLEDEKLIDAMLELKQKGLYCAEGGQFKIGYQKELEKLLQETLPGHGLKENPHIQSRIKLLKKQYHDYYDLLALGQGSGFGWDDKNKCVTANPDVWDDYLKRHPTCNIKGKPFIWYEQLAIIWGKDRATGNNVEAPGDVVEVLDKEKESDDDEGLENIDPSNTQRPKRLGVDDSGQRQQKRRRSADGLIFGLERMSEVFTNHLKESRDQMAKLVEAIAASEQHNIDNQHKVNEELRKIDGLSFSERHKTGRALVRDKDLLNYFFSLENDEKEPFEKDLLQSNDI